MKNVLIVAPHADDETLGCGGTILRHIAAGDSVHWLLVTTMSGSASYTEQQISNRQSEIKKVAASYQFSSVIQLNFAPAMLDTLPKSQLIGTISNEISTLEPSIIYVPYRNDAHSDHEYVFDATLACCKSFRAPFVRQVLAYETMSETDFGFKPEDGGFRPNYYVDITDFLQQKLQILNIYSSEVAQFPFPRSEQALQALSMVRGSQCGVNAAESFMMLREIVK